MCNGVVWLSVDELQAKIKEDDFIVDIGDGLRIIPIFRMLKIIDELSIINE